jgi:hypothetical protein
MIASQITQPSQASQIQGNAGKEFPFFWFPIKIATKGRETMAQLGRMIARLLLASALSLVFVVIPSAKTDTFPTATPERAVPVLWIIALLLAAFASVQWYFFSAPERLRNVGPKGLLVAMACLLLLIGLAQVDGAIAYRGHGPHMHLASVMMFATSGICIIDGLFSILAVIMKSKAQPVQNA